MVETEQYFPRGGKKPKTQFNERKKFDFLGNADRIGKKRKYRGPKINLEEEDEGGYLSDKSYDSDDDKGTIKSASAEGISLRTIQEGMVILGRVLQVYDTKLLISLPGRIVGVVMASNISTPYTNLLKSFVDGNIDDIKKPVDLFHIGEYVSVKVISESLDGKKRNVNVSLMPQDVNCGIHFSNLKEGMLLRAAISSIEDHGYVLDLGIANARPFLPKKFADESLPLDVGQVIWCTVKKCQTSGTNSIVTLTNSLDKIKSTSISGNAMQNYTVADLKPGMALSFSVNKPLSDGAEGIILKDSVGYIHVSQIGSKLKIGQKVNARVLYVMSVSKLPFLTTRKIFESYRPNDEANLKIGQICESAKVTKVTRKSVILKLGKKEVGIIKLKDCVENDAAERYPLGSEHKVRILSYDFSDYAYQCTDEEEILEQKYFDLNDLTLGEYVDAVVEDVQDKFVTVKVGTLVGRIPELHASDVGVFNQNKKPGTKVSESLMRKKFKPGQKLQARVLKVNPASSIFHVTVKPSFMDPNTSILCRIEDVQVGKQYKGVVVCHLKYGILVGFFGEVKAFVHVSQLSHDRIKDISSVFFLGQVVNCTILSVNNEKIEASLIKLPDEVDQKNRFKETDGNLVGGEEKLKNKKRKMENTDEHSDQTVEEVPHKKKKNKKQDECVEHTIDDKMSKKKDKAVKEDCKVDNKKKNKHNESIEDIVVDKISKKKDKQFGEDVKVDKKKKKGQNELNDSNNQNNSIEDMNEVVTTKNKTKKIEKLKEDCSSETIEEDGPSKKKKKLENEVTNEKQKSNKANDVKKSNKPVTNDKGELKQLGDGGLKFSSMSSFFDLGPTTIVKNISKGSVESSSESDEEKEEEKSKKKKKKLSAAEKVEKARQEEEKLRAIERELADLSTQPKSSDQFERLLLANPNSSELWIAYMAFHLQATEIERARTVGQKALKTISFREEQDKLNVWLALLNLENRFGTQESLSSTLQQALQMNDPFSVHSKMLDMYLDTGKVQDVLFLVDLMVSKYRNNPKTYIITGEACFKLNNVDKARSIMQKAVNRLEYKTHVPILIKFAQMENNRGDTERAEALFEQIVGCLPQRVDIWCVYVDMLLKSNKIDSIRLVLERAVSQKLPLKKMKLLYKKWVEIEEKLGDAEQVEKVRRMALDFITKIKC